jgi:hypothetical protein
MRKLVFVLIALLVGFLGPRIAHAQMTAQPSPVNGSEEPEPTFRLPVAVAQRPLTLPHFILRPTIEIDGTREIGGNAFTNLALSGAFGITDDIAVRATVLPLQLTGPEGVHYGQSSEYVGPTAGATVRFLRGVAEMGLSFDGGPYTTTNTTGVVLEPSIPMLFHLGKKARISTGLDLTIRDYKEQGVLATVAPAGVAVTTTNASFVTETFQIPVTLLYNVVDVFYVSASSGVEHIFRSTDPLTRIPLGVGAGYAIAGKNGPVLEIEPFFTFFSILTPQGTPTNETGSWRLGLNVQGFFYL